MRVQVIAVCFRCYDDARRLIMVLTDMKVVAFYKFMPIAAPAEVAEKIRALRERFPVSGTLIVADEGINSTIAGQDADTDAFLTELQAMIGTLEPKYSWCEFDPFHRFKVKEKPEIVTFHDKDVGADKLVGTYVAPEHWNELVRREDVLLLDTRNRYETRIGSFKGAEDPDVDSFVEFKDYLDAVIEKRGIKKIAMFCTGGIRCEKSTGYALAKGVEEVYHLDGGILNYLEKVPEEQSLWEGECFVFDHRVSVDHGLNCGSYTLCHSCGYPVSDQERQSEQYEEGVCCPACHNRTTEEQKARFRERRKQMHLASCSGHKHIGADMAELVRAKVQRKKVLAERSAAAEAAAPAKQVA